ncbi:MAG: hypothetical protein Ct9H300mP20_00600 [Gammaproteobacteria bacterium]|nr:MAG: hypothetical protein Ct9H300mP20_00600 [Gammaproteobacteria bacterium]
MSAHGTNPASAQMVGMKIIPINCDKEGNIDLTDLQEKAKENSNNLSSIMITYPSTHGVFETNVRKVCEVVQNTGSGLYRWRKPKCHDWFMLPRRIWR